MRDDPVAVHELLLTWDVNEERYYSLRADTPEPRTVYEAARFLYLNRFGFNGLYRENLAGRFNVPYGRPKNTTIIPLEVLTSASAVLVGVTILERDFEESIEGAKEGDFVFLDPPYASPRHRSGFTDYNAKMFWLAGSATFGSCIP